MFTITLKSCVLIQTGFKMTSALDKLSSSLKDVQVWMESVRNAGTIAQGQISLLESRLAWGQGEHNNFTIPSRDEVSSKANSKLRAGTSENSSASKGFCSVLGKGSNGDSTNTPQSIQECKVRLPLLWTMLDLDNL